MTDEELEMKLRECIQRERVTTNEILVLINDAEDRRLHLKRGCSTIFRWLVECYGYSEPAANRRISAARLFRKAPEVLQKLESGSVNLTTLAQARCHIRAHEKLTGKKADVKQVIQVVENKSVVDSKLALLSLFPETALEVKRVHKKAISATHSRLSVNLANETIRDLERIEDLLSGAIENVDLADVITQIAKYYLKEKDPLRSTSAAAKLRVTKEAEGQCEYVDAQTGKRCCETFRFQTDHIQPKAMGGSNARENLRGLCRQHNLYMAERKLGKSWANSWRAKREERAKPKRN